MGLSALKVPGNRILRKILVLMCLPLFFLAAQGQVVINEFSAANSSLIADPEHQNYADWIELFNAGSTDQNLKGYFITDDLDVPGKWQINLDTILPAGNHLIIWADGLDYGLHAAFRLSAEGEEIGLYDPGLTLVDSIIYPYQKSDVSMGREADGGNKWVYFTEASPGFANSGPSYRGFTSLVPEFSQGGGFYSSPLPVELSSGQGGKIRFTLDGSEPDEGSAIYDAAIPVDSTTIIRARIFEEAMIPGPTLTQSYFINENSLEGKLPVVSIASAPRNFWDPEQGIYVQDFKPGWEIPVNIELFENDGSDRAAFNRAAGMKVNGLYSWQLPQKMLGVYFKKRYGEGNLDYPLLQQRKRSSYKSFALRASGSDWSYTLFRDVLGQHSTLLNMEVDIMAYRPSVVFVNGEYLGIHNIREKVDDDYIEKSYQMEAGSFDLVENEDFAEAGNLEAYQELEILLRKDLSVDVNYNAVTELVDIENFTDYVITEMATGNTSIDHNVMAWKPKEGGKWRWVLMDLDRGFFKPHENRISFYRSKDELILDELLDNATYRSYFARRLNGQLFTSFNPKRMNALIREHTEDIETEIPKHIARWEGRTSNYGDALPSEEYWRRQIMKVKYFVEARPLVLISDLDNYGFDSIANLVLDNYPARGGSLRMDGLKLPGSSACGPFNMNLPVDLEAESKPGYDFVGWVQPRKQYLLSRGEEWSYLDNGIYPGSGWIDPGFNDADWSKGKAELGYGDDDEETRIGYGGDPDQKHISTWFRKSFSVSGNDLQADQFILELLMDDGAIIYLNGIEIVRSNMSYDPATSQSTALSTISGDEETRFLYYTVDGSLLNSGENTLAVEIHQYNGTSTDLSFNLGFFALFSEGASIIENSKNFLLNLSGDLCLTALYEANGSCILPELVDGDLRLSLDCSPYLVQGDVRITESGRLTIDPGVEIWMPEGASIYVEGSVEALGTEELPIYIKLNPDFSDPWGVISFRHTPQKSLLRWVHIEDASTGPDPVKERAAISAFYADLDLDHIFIEQVHGDPVAARYSDIALTNSSLHSEVTGDLINVKYGKARIENCSFRGNNQPDTDAIDYDEVSDGIILKSIIRDFKGLNSDAIDIGEKATGVLIDSIVVFNITDKGVSVGQKSSVSIRNSVFINCNMGVGVKDSAHLTVDRSLFYGNVDAIAAFEKNPGMAGGNVVVTNSILSNSSHASYYADEKSSLEISHSLSDNTLLPPQASNLFGNPNFRDPSFYNFYLEAGSPAILSGSHNNLPINMGNSISVGELEPSIMISEFYINGDGLDFPEYIKLYNPGTDRVDVSGYTVTKGVTAIIPEGISLGAGGSLYLTNDAGAAIWDDLFYQVFQWADGQLSNDGEAIQLEDGHGIVLDHLFYDKNGFWHGEGFVGDGVFKLIRPGMDNHFPESWEVHAVSQLVSLQVEKVPSSFKVYPNPTRDVINIHAPDNQNQKLEIFDLSGKCLGEYMLDHQGEASLNLSAYPPGLLFIRLGARVEKVILLNY